MIVEFHFPLFSQLGLSYALASGGAVGTALGINKLVSVSNHNVTIVSLDITLMITSASVKSNKCRKAHYVKHCMCIQIDQNIKYFSEKFRKYFVIYICFISSPEHEVLMVSYCGQWLSVVRRRPLCVVRQHLMFTL